MAFASSSRANMVCCTGGTYFNAYVAPTQGGSSRYDDLCNTAISSSQALTPGAVYATVSLIDVSGGWRRSLRSNQSFMAVFVNPNTEAGATAYSKKAHCNNSDNSVVYLIRCDLVAYYAGGICA
jgi:hypothetical protein